MSDKEDCENEINASNDCSASSSPSKLILLHLLYFCDQILERFRDQTIVLKFLIILFFLIDMFSSNRYRGA